MDAEPPCQSLMHAVTTPDLHSALLVLHGNPHADRIPLLSIGIALCRISLWHGEALGCMRRCLQSRCLVVPDGRVESQLDSCGALSIGQVFPQPLGRCRGSVWVSAEETLQADSD